MDENKEESLWRMKLVVLGGGDSPEREVSLRSAKAVAEAARQAGYVVIEADPHDGLEILNNLDMGSIVFPILHGAGGEDGQLQKILEDKKIAFLGTNAAASANCFDKWKTRQILLAAGISMPKGGLVDRKTYKDHKLAAQPHVLKILHGGSSIGTLLVRDPANLSDEQVDIIYKMENQAVIEELIAGTEITVPILDKRALPVIEIVPPAEEEFDYENKYNGRTQELCPPVSVSAELQKHAQVLAEKVHKTLNGRHLSRVDIMIDKHNNLYVLEINTMPGMTSQSLYPKSAALEGLEMPQLVKRFAELVRMDYKISI